MIFVLECFNKPKIQIKSGLLIYPPGSDFSFNYVREIELIMNLYIVKRNESSMEATDLINRVLYRLGVSNSLLRGPKIILFWRRVK